MQWVYINYSRKPHIVIDICWRGLIAPENAHGVVPIIGHQQVEFAIPIHICHSYRLWAATRARVVSHPRLKGSVAIAREYAHSVALKTACQQIKPAVTVHIRDPYRDCTDAARATDHRRLEGSIPVG